MSNFDIARETLDTALYDSDGSAQKELGNYQKGIEYSLDKFKATFQQLSTDFLDSGVFKTVVDGGTEVIDILDKIVSVGNGIPAIFAAIGGIKLFKNLDLFYIKNWSPHTQGHNKNGIVTSVCCYVLKQED